MLHRHSMCGAYMFVERSGKREAIRSVSVQFQKCLTLYLETEDTQMFKIAYSAGYFTNPQMHDWLPLLLWNLIWMHA